MEINNFLQWRTEYSIGIPEIDNQHKEIMHLVVTLLKICQEEPHEDQYESFHTLALVIIERFQKHFETEEKLMLENKYPHYEKHKQRHDKLLEDVQGMLERIRAEKKKSLLINMVIFLREWFVENIYGVDKQMGEFFKMRG